MANGFSTFKSEHQYVAGITMITVGIVGLYGAATGYLASMLAALFAPDLLIASSGKQADRGGVAQQAVSGANSAATAILAINPITGPIVWAEKSVTNALGF